jgi:hypothetical protein
VDTQDDLILLWLLPSLILTLNRDVGLCRKLCKNADILALQARSDALPEAILCSHRFHQSANAQNAHYPFHVIGQDVQRHFGTDVLERFPAEVATGAFDTADVRFAPEAAVP